MTIDSDGRDASLAPEEAFALLGHETRVAILLALWDSFESASRDNEVSYSALFDRVDIRDSGNFSYHLEKLTGPFVRRTDAGYELKQTGINVVRAVVEGTVVDDPTFGPVSIDLACPICRSQTEITYADELMTISCTACDGRIEWNDEGGHIFGAPVPPAGIEQRPIEETFRSAVVFTMYKLASFLDGVCPDCSSSIETTVDVCSDHDAGEATRCPTCDRRNLAEVLAACPTCKLRVFLPVTLAVLNDPTVAAGYHGRDIEHRFASWRTVDRSFQVREELASEEPLELRLTFPAGEDDEFSLTVDRELNVSDTAA